MNFRDIVGHEDIIKHFKSSIEMDKVAHAYIITGEVGSGKKALARARAGQSSSSSSARIDEEKTRPTTQGRDESQSCVTRRFFFSCPRRGQRRGISLEEENNEIPGSNLATVRAKPNQTVGWVYVKLQREWNCNGQLKKVIAREGFPAMPKSVWMDVKFM